MRIFHIEPRKTARSAIRATRPLVIREAAPIRIGAAAPLTVAAEEPPAIPPAAAVAIGAHDAAAARVAAPLGVGAEAAGAVGRVALAPVVVAVEVGAHGGREEVACGVDAGATVAAGDEGWEGGVAVGGVLRGADGDADVCVAWSAAVFGGGGEGGLGDHVSLSHFYAVEGSRYAFCVCVSLSFSLPNRIQMLSIEIAKKKLGDLQGGRLVGRREIDTAIGPEETADIARPGRKKRRRRRRSPEIGRAHV